MCRPTFSNCREVRDFQYNSYIWFSWPWYCSVLFTHSQLGVGTSPDSYKNAWRPGCFSRARKFGFCDTNYTTAELLDNADARLFRLVLVQRPEHCLYHLLPDTVDSCPMELRHSGHSFPLPQCKCNLYKNLFHGVCWNMFNVRRLYISSNVLCVHAFPAMLAFVEHK